MSYHAGAVRLKYEGALTCIGAPGFCQAVRTALQGDATYLELNLEEVKHADAVGLAALWQAARHAGERGIACTILPSAVVYRALLRAELLDELPLKGPVSGADPTEATEAVLDESALTPLAASGRIALRPPAWDELSLFAKWANEPLLDQMVGSPLLYHCRHTGPYHPEFVERVLYDPTAVTLLIESAEAAGDGRYGALP